MRDWREEGMEGRKKRRRDGGREGGREGAKAGESEGGREKRREGGIFRTTWKHLWQDVTA